MNGMNEEIDCKNECYNKWMSGWINHRMNAWVN